MVSCQLYWWSRGVAIKPDVVCVTGFVLAATVGGCDGYVRTELGSSFGSEPDGYFRRESDRFCTDFGCAFLPLPLPGLRASRRRSSLRGLRRSGWSARYSRISA